MTVENSQRLQKAANDFYYLITQLSAYHVWFRCILPKLNKTDEYHCRLVQNAVVNSQLINCRKLNEFFYARPKKELYPDDLRAYKFGFEKHGPFLSETEMDELNKSIAHPTFRSADEGVVSFDIYRFSWLAVRHGLDFANYLQNSFFAKMPKSAEQAARIIKIVRDSWSEWTEAMPANERRIL